MNFLRSITAALTILILTAPYPASHAENNDNVAVSNVVARANCPVQLQTPTRRGNVLHLAFRNMSGKKIRGILFGAAYYDELQEPHMIQVLTDEHRVIASGAVETGDLNIAYWKHSHYLGWATWPSKILYADGSRWQLGPNASSCIVNYWLDGQHPMTMLATGATFNAQVQLADSR